MIAWDERNFEADGVYNYPVKRLIGLVTTDYNKNLIPSKLSSRHGPPLSRALGELLSDKQRSNKPDVAGYFDQVLSMTNYYLIPVIIAETSLFPYDLGSNQEAVLKRLAFEVWKAHHFLTFYLPRVLGDQQVWNLRTLVLECVRSELPRFHFRDGITEYAGVPDDTPVERQMATQSLHSNNIARVMTVIKLASSSGLGGFPIPVDRLNGGPKSRVKVIPDVAVALKSLVEVRESVYVFRLHHPNFPTEIACRQRAAMRQGEGPHRRT